MDEAHKKAQTTRERNQEARTARLALQRVLESQKATPAEILEAARLLVEIGR